MGNVCIPICEEQSEIGSLILEDVLIVPNLDRHLFSVHAFLSKGHNWVHFSQTEIQLGIKNGYYLATGLKPDVKHFRVFGCLAVFKHYEVSDNGKWVNNKYTQQGMRGIFVGLPDDSAG